MTKQLHFNLEHHSVVGKRSNDWRFRQFQHRF